MRKLYKFRVRHNISLTEMAEYCGVSGQRISVVEHSDSVLKKETSDKIISGLYRLAESRCDNAELLKEEISYDLLMPEEPL